MSRRPTIIDVAKAAGVSKSTVSLVVRNSPSIRKETRDQVRKAMAEIGYVYNRSAANMRTSNAGLVGLVINDLLNPFFAEFATSLQMALTEKGYATVIANTDENPELQEQVVSTMIEHGVSALIICSTFGATRPTFDAIEQSGVPAVQMLRKADDRLDVFPFMAPDYTQGSVIATQHLLDQGARNIAFVGGIEGASVTQERMSGYQSLLAQRGIKPLILNGKASREFGIEVADKLIKDHPSVDAVLCFNDLVAMGLLVGFHRQSHSVKDSIAIVGFDDIQEASLISPTLTSVSCDIANFGSAAANSVVTWLEDGTMPKTESRTPVSLVIRETS